MQRFVLRLAVAALATLSSTWAMANDQEVAQRIARALRESGRLVNYGIGVKYHDGTVWLMGRVSSKQQMAVALALTEKMPGVKQVVNNLTIAARPATPATPQAAQQASAQSKPSSAPSDLQQPQVAILGRVRKPETNGPVVRSASLAPAPFADLEAQTRANTDPKVRPTAFPKESEPDLAPSPVDQNAPQAGDAAQQDSDPGALETPELAAPEQAPAPKRSKPHPFPLQAPELAAPEQAGPSLHQASTGRSLLRRRVYERTPELAKLPAEEEQTDSPETNAPSARPAPHPQWLAQAEQLRQAPRQVRARPAAGSARVPVSPGLQPRRGAPRPIAPATGARQVPTYPQNARQPLRVAHLPQGGDEGGNADVGEYVEGSIGQPMPMHSHASYAGAAPMTYDQPHLPNYAWPSYAAYPNYAGVTYPRQYSPTCWPYIGPFYPYPQVPLGWRKVTLEWDDGWWYLDFDQHR